MLEGTPCTLSGFLFNVFPSLCVLLPSTYPFQDGRSYERYFLQDISNTRFMLYADALSFPCHAIVLLMKSDMSEVIVYSQKTQDSCGKVAFPHSIHQIEQYIS